MVITEVINDEFGILVPGDFTMTVIGGNPAPASFPGQRPPGRSVTLDPGGYGTGVVPRPGYGITSLSPDCGGTIAAGQTKTCTVTVDDHDSDAPTITCVSPGVNWHGDNVFLACRAGDAGSGLANPFDDLFSLFTSVPEGVEDGNASTGTRQVCDVAGNCAVAGPITGVKIDRKAPTLSLPEDLVVEATSPAGASVSFIVSAADGADPNPSLSCRPASGSVFAIGATTVACTATDHVGHASHGSFAITVLGAPEQLAGLVAEVLAASSLPAAVKAELLARIQPLLAAFDPSNPAQRRAVCTGLRAFAAVLRLLSGRGVPPAQATAWIADANGIRAVLGC